MNASEEYDFNELLRLLSFAREDVEERLKAIIIECENRIYDDRVLEQELFLALIDAALEKHIIAPR